MSAETYGAHHRDGSYTVARFRAVCKLADALMASELGRDAHREPGWSVLDIHRGLDHETLRRAINIRANRRLP